MNFDLRQRAREQTCLVCGGGGRMRVVFPSRAARVMDRVFDPQPVGAALCGPPGPGASTASVREAPGGAGAEGTSGALDAESELELAERLVSAVLEHCDAWGAPATPAVDCDHTRARLAVLAVLERSLQLVLRSVLLAYRQEFGPSGYTAEYFLEFVAVQVGFCHDATSKAVLFQRLANQTRAQFERLAAELEP